ncbi:MAG: PEP-CTERM sorting domain-containing protein [Alkalimonas sp.]|nr:PEP-CTERM sorting domain-containing protein [Alkalimonas sp.]
MFSNDFGDGVIESDLQLTGSAQFNAGNPFSQVGTLDVRGNSIPEPATLGILGLGLLGLGGMARRKKA